MADKYKASMSAGQFRISAWQDKCGLFRLVIRNVEGGRVMCGLNHPWEKLANNSARLVFTDNRYIIEEICDSSSPDRRSSPQLLRRAGKNSTYRSWFVAERTRTPEAAADRIEAIRRKEGRDPRTGRAIAARRPQ
jgi:hypothetical protein